MLKKIKKYKIHLRPAIIAKSLKQKLALDVGNDPLDKIIAEEINKSQDLFFPSALYNTFSKKDTPESLETLWQQAPKKALSLSLMVSTIGKALEQKLSEKEVQNGSQDFKRALLESIAWEAVEQSSHFVYRLLNEESRLEGYECTPFFPVEARLNKPCLEILESHKAQIHLDSTDQISPFFSRLNFCFWTPVNPRAAIGCENRDEKDGCFSKPKK